MHRKCGCSSMAELQLPKLTAWVRFPSPAPTARLAFIAQSVERIHGKDEVISSILIKGSKQKGFRKEAFFCLGPLIRLVQVILALPWMRAGCVSRQLCGRRIEHAKERDRREAEHMIICEHRRSVPATTAGDGYPTANSRHGKDEVWFDSD